MPCSPAERRRKEHLPASLNLALPTRKGNPKRGSFEQIPDALLPLPLAEIVTQLKNKDFNVKTLWKQPPEKEWGT